MPCPRAQAASAITSTAHRAGRPRIARYRDRHDKSITTVLTQFIYIIHGTLNMQWWTIIPSPSHDNRATRDSIQTVIDKGAKTAWAQHTAGVPAIQSCCTLSVTKQTRHRDTIHAQVRPQIITTSRCHHAKLPRTPVSTPPHRPNQSSPHRAQPLHHSAHCSRTTTASTGFFVGVCCGFPAPAAFVAAFDDFLAALAPFPAALPSDLRAADSVSNVLSSASSRKPPNSMV